ncbi:hypothetical protein CR205_12960 [Alteribacter lacisalsi]|uniref:CRISPR associated protein Cas6 C-terminal domain-containing protein n=1 Tax=Alteribacter lacisalsi TaxID=2045244 RepID=A0A2W0H6K2_9BACI|nr:CRISPR-associated endoribonuclease Cas6 [Alteribacter lacisalsi]PYZ96611.1 hypothetical protein CR205_12960 [Alteribacter lacisalsi]
MDIKELKITLILKEDVPFKNIGQRIGAYLHRAMLADSQLKKEHRVNKVKHYVYSHLYPTESDGVYKSGTGYTFRIRSAREGFLNRMAELLTDFQDELIVTLGIEESRVPNGTVNAVRTLTPFVITLGKPGSKYWKAYDAKEDIKKLLTNNVSNRFKQFIGAKEVNHDFIKEVKILNNKPTYYNYKGRKVLANKVEVYFNDDLFSKQIRDYVVSAGLGEKSSVLGAGFSETIRRA